MYTLIRSQSLKNLLIQQTPALLLAFFIAETFYKFRSFTLECAAFLVTWFVIDFILANVLARFAKPQTTG
jgi:hypothetical protein